VTSLTREVRPLGQPQATSNACPPGIALQQVNRRHRQAVDCNQAEMIQAIYICQINSVYILQARNAISSKTMTGTMS